MIKAIIFDFFDVIRSDQYKAWLKANGFVREGIFKEVTDKLDSGQITLDEFFETLSKASGEKLTHEKLEAYAQANHEVIALFPKLKKHYKLAILSNAPSKFFRDLLYKHDLEKYFDEIIVSSEVGHIKPNKEIFEIALQKLGVNAHEAIFIDDYKHNVEGAEKVGIKGIHFASAEQLTKELVNLGVVI